MIKLEEFFNFNVNEPINRVAYTEEDIKYKIKIIQKMQEELGMKVTVDEALNICGTIEIGNYPEKILAMGSHTDSVGNGGQYDGPAGVIAALQVVEQLKKAKKINGIVKVVIYSCEESTRFRNACIGSKYLNGDITKKDFCSIIDENGITLEQATRQAKENLMKQTKGIEEVEKIFEKEEIDYSLESHIEQYQILQERYQKEKKEQIGIITSVGSAVRIKYEAQGEKAHTGSTPMDERKNAFDAICYIGRKATKLGKKYEKQGLGRVSPIGGSVIDDDGGYNQIKDRATSRIDFRLFGENTPEKVLQDFSKIIQKAEKKTRTKIIPTIESKGTPAITDVELNTRIAQICEQKGIEYTEMISAAGQDTGYIPAKQKTMIFIRSRGGSHNKNEQTDKEAIEISSQVLLEMAGELLKEKFKDQYKCEVKKTKEIRQIESEKQKSNKEGENVKEIIKD